MKPSAYTLSHWCLRILLVSMGLSFLFALSVMYAPSEEFVGSPPRENQYAPQKSSMNFERRGVWRERFLKTLRPDDYLKVIGPALWATPVVHYLAGWDVMGEHICVRGEMVDGYIARDGDINYLLHLEPQYDRYASLHRGEKMEAGTILIEIPLKLRANFPIVYDIVPGDTLFVCGRYVLDRGHGGWAEIHPARWIEIVK